MLSMTGYGKGECKEGGIELTCEIKTVNNRYLDVSVKAPKIFMAYEDVIRGPPLSRWTSRSPCPTPRRRRRSKRRFRPSKTI